MTLPGADFSGLCGLCGRIDSVGYYERRMAQFVGTVVNQSLGMLP